MVSKKELKWIKDKLDKNLRNCADSTLYSKVMYSLHSKEIIRIINPIENKGKVYCHWYIRKEYWDYFNKLLTNEPS